MNMDMEHFGKRQLAGKVLLCLMKPSPCRMNAKTGQPF